MTFFNKYPDLIIDRVWEVLSPQVYEKGKLIMNKGDNSTFMLILYDGSIGIYLQTYEELVETGFESKCIHVKTDQGVLGERGLLTRAPRSATCIAQSNVRALSLTSMNYEKIIENFHRTEINNNTKFTESLDFMRDISFNKIDQLVQYYNSIMYKKGQWIVNFDENPKQLFILKEGRLKVEK